MYPMACNALLPHSGKILYSLIPLTTCRTEFRALLEAGKTQEALQLLRSQMTPLSQQHPHLQPKLQVQVHPLGTVQSPSMRLASCSCGAHLL